jgi:hypothetical protein
VNDIKNFPHQFNSRAAEVASHLDGRREGRGWRCLCPVHNGHALIINDGGPLGFLFDCKGGCDGRAVLAELRARGLLNGTLAAPRNANHLDKSIHGRSARECDDSGRIARAKAIWNAAGDGRGSPAERYLRECRRIFLDEWPPSLRYQPNCPHPNGGQHPALIGLVEHTGRGIVGIHRVFLNPTGTAKAEVEREKASLGPIKGGAIRFGSPKAGEWFVVAEGPENTLTVAVTCSMPAWSALSAPGLRSLILPAEATHIIIAADHDLNGVGQRAARAAADRFISEGRRVRIALPPIAGTDFNSILNEVHCG